MARLGLAALAGLVLGSGCAQQAIVLYTVREGNQRVYPHFIDQPTVIAFWSPDNIRSIEALPALNTLTHREGPVWLTSVCVARDRTRMIKWMRKEDVVFEVLHDPGERLARKLGVDSYPTYVFFDAAGTEIARSLTVRTIHNWFDRERWLRRADPRWQEDDRSRGEYVPVESYGPRTGPDADDGAPPAPDGRGTSEGRGSTGEAPRRSRSGSSSYPDVYR